jgi:hypothetical protein
MLFKFYEREDFARCNFSAKWDQYLNKHGDGVKIKFPIKMKIHLSQSPKVSISHDNELIPGKECTWSALHSTLFASLYHVINESKIS